jgi:hypothetical protein
MKSSQLWVHRGGAAKKIPYVCHLCQKHRDGIARQNQMPFGTCSLCPSAQACHNYQMIDDEVLARSLEIPYQEQRQGW